jgi:hypothetical protein
VEWIIPTVLLLQLLISLDKNFSLHLQIILLSPCPCVLIEMPLDIALLIVQCASPNLEEAHAHARPNLGKLHGLIACLHKDVVADFDCVFDVLESVSVSNAS